MIRIRVILLLLLTFIKAIAQPESEKPFIRFKNLSDDVASGLSEEKQPNCFFQDSHGFIWIGDITSFKYYDGYNLKEYKLKVVLPKTMENLLPHS